MRMWRSMVVLLVSVVGKCCGRLKCLRTCMGWRLNLTWLKLRIPRLIMNRKNLLQRNIQTSSCKTNAKRYRIIFASVLCLFTCCTFYTEKTKKNVLHNLTRMLMCSYCGDVAKQIWRWYSCGYVVVSNVVMAFKYCISKNRLHMWWVVTYVIVVYDWKKWKLGGGARWEGTV